MVRPATPEPLMSGVLSTLVWLGRELQIEVTGGVERGTGRRVKSDRRRLGGRSMVGR